MVVGVVVVVFGVVGVVLSGSFLGVVFGVGVGVGVGFWVVVQERHPG